MQQWSKQRIRVDMMGCGRRITSTIGGEVFVEPPSAARIVALLASVVDIDEIVGLEYELPRTEAR
jgi:hypothetical protein